MHSLASSAAGAGIRSWRPGRAQIDTRYWQIAALCCFVTYALTQLRAPIVPINAALFIAGALASEFVAARFRGTAFDFRSPLITALSLTLLLRTDSAVLAFVVAAGAIGSKQLLRVHGKQVFNPSNIAIVVVTLVSSHAWVSPGGWGHEAWLVGLLGCVGMLVTARATRIDLAAVFLGGWALALCLRALWLGDPLAITLHQLCDGTLLIFSFFMITDPRATPDDVRARIAFALLLIASAFVLRFVFFVPDALLWALALVSPCSPLLDRLMPARRFTWQRAAPTSSFAKE